MNPGQVNDHGVNFALVNGLMSVTVHIPGSRELFSFRCPGATSKGVLPIAQHRVTRFAGVTSLHANKTPKLP